MVDGTPIASLAGRFYSRRVRTILGVPSYGGPTALYGQTGN